jgi:tetratricopeptide (TPR) repeat protein
MSEELSKADRYNRNTALMNFCASSLAVSGVVLANWSAFTASFNNLTTLITAETYLNRGNVRSDLGDKKGAIDDYTQAIKLKPDKDSAYLNRGVDRFDLDDKKGAIDDYTQAAEIYKKQGKMKESLNILNRIELISK